VESEIEIVSLMLQSLDKAGLEEVTLDLGHVGIYHALVARTQLSEDEQTELYGLLRLRALPELSAWLAKSSLSDQEQTIFKNLPSMAGSLDDLTQWQVVFNDSPDEVKAAIETLKIIATEISRRFSQVRVHIDLAELRDFNYHTGLVFSAFVPGFGQPVARGGRYDHTGEVFGRSRPATGYSSDLKVLASLTVADWSETAAILAPADSDPALRNKIVELRDQGERGIQLFNGQQHLDELSADRELINIDGQWKVQPISQNRQG
jgi:ATP phosphoribosyltransferase regulatory subunit